MLCNSARPWLSYSKWNDFTVCISYSCGNKSLQKQPIKITQVKDFIKSKPDLVSTDLNQIPSRCCRGNLCFVLFLFLPLSASMLPEPSVSVFLISLCPNPLVLLSCGPRLPWFHTDNLLKFLASGPLISSQLYGSSCNMWWVRMRNTPIGSYVWVHVSLVVELFAND